MLLSFLDLLGDRLELFLELCCLCQHLRGLLLDCIHYLDCHFVVDQSCTFCLGLCYLCLSLLYLCQYFCYPFLQWLYLILTLLFLRLRSDEFCLHLLHLLHPFDSFWDWYGLLLLLELLDRCIDPFLFLVPPLDLWILLQPCPKLCCFIKQVSCCDNLLLYLLQCVVASCFLCSLIVGGVVGVSCSRRFSISF
jgi:hypothetical protein